MSVPAPPANLNKAHDSAVAASTAAELSGDQQQQQPASTTTTTAAATGSSSTAALSASFEPPFPASTSFPTWSFVIEFCDRCRWLHRATWNQTELFQTFGPKGPSSSSPSTSGDAEGVRSITLLPMTEEATAGRYRIWVYGGAREPVCVWDRKTMGGFPELKELKQAIRDVISPGQSLGHSDKGMHGSSQTSTTAPTSTSTQGEPKDRHQGKPTWGTGHEENVGTASITGASG
ncbi:unnamed protein product [Jaminaea pallidilutea]